jgi:hypothetical protein
VGEGAYAVALRVAERLIDADARLQRLGLQAYSLGIAFEFDPYFGLSISRVSTSCRTSLKRSTTTS